MGSDQNTHDLEIAFQAVQVETFSAAVLQAFGCPTAEVVARRIVVPAVFGDFQVAVVGGVGVGDGGVAHWLRCRSAWTLEPVRPDQVGQITRRRCSISCGGSAALAISGPPQFVDDVKRLTGQLHAALEHHPPEEEHGVHAELRTVRIGRAIGEVLHHFAGHAIVPAALAAVLDRCDAWAQDRASAARRLLYLDGLDRLAAQWQREATAWQGYESPDVQRRVTGQISTAQAAIPGADDNHVACMFQGVPEAVAAAVDAAQVSVHREGTHPGVETAIAVLPRPVAVALHLHCALQGSLLPQPLVHAETVQVGREDLGTLCGTALRLWDGGAVPPQMAWHAALASAQ